MSKNLRDWIELPLAILKVLMCPYPDRVYKNMVTEFLPTYPKMTFPLLVILTILKHRSKIIK